jgi:hypothetical protein
LYRSSFNIGIILLHTVLPKCSMFGHNGGSMEANPTVKLTRCSRAVSGCRHLQLQ